MRGERLNLALVVFGANDLHVHPARNLDKIKAISAALDKTSVEQALDNLLILDRNLFEDGLVDVEERVAALTQLSSLSLTACGNFTAPDASSYDEEVQRLLLQLVEPEPAPRRFKPQKKTRLLSSLKSALRSEKILAQKGEGIDSHRFVADQELADGLSADLLLKNGAMHVVQTVDASNSDRIRRAVQEVGVSALVFEQARIRFGENQTRPRLVYAASASLEKSLNPALYAAEHQGAELINWESQEQRTSFIVEASSLAEPTTGQKKADFGGVHASAQDIRRIN